jgi:alpha-D-ribose 1-methylphosphonate 5-triphosphate synthase subunit PhnH
MKALGVDPVHDTRETFRALVDAASRPGTVETTPVGPAAHAVVSTLVDHEVTFCGDDEAVLSALERESRLDEASFETADVVLVDGHTDGRVTDAKRGTLKEPSGGATLVYAVEALTESTDEGDAEPRDDTVDPLELAVSGPGVPGRRTFGVDGLPPEEVAAIASAQSTYPRGVDVYVAADDRVAALPRSVDVELVEGEA